MIHKRSTALEWLNTKRNITQTSKETNWWKFDESFAGGLENIIKL